MLENPTVFDFTIIGLIVFLGLKGLFNGFFKEVFSIIGIVGGIFLGTRFGTEAGQYLNENFLHLDDGKVIFFTGFLATLLAVWVLMNVLSWVISKIGDAVGLGPLNKLLGFLFAGTKIALILSVIIHALMSVKLVADYAHEKESIQNSELLPHLQKIGSFIINTDFKEVKKDVEEAINLDDNSNAKQILDTGLEVVEDATKSISDGVSELQETVKKSAEDKIEEAIDSHLDTTLDK
jgi:membrane protein required for colicin V production